MMPATSSKQKKFMDAVAHNPAFAKKAGVPQSVGKEFSETSKGIKFKGGPRSRPDLQKVNKSKTLQGKNELFANGGDVAESKAMVKKEVSFMKKKGAPATMIKHEESEMKAKKMAKGGMTASKMGTVKTAAPSRDGVAVKGKTKGKMISMPGNKGMKNGGKTC
jgi:23S rRNA A1618 N6-methylase RlmF